MPRRNKTENKKGYYILRRKIYLFVEEKKTWKEKEENILRRKICFICGGKGEKIF